LAAFIKGIELCESFFLECGLPIIRNNFPDLEFTAGLLGYGSDVIGFDDNVSTDHMWGPRFYLFLSKRDMHLRDKLMELFRANLPYSFKDYSVNFSEPDPNDNGVRHAELIASGQVSPLIWIYEVDEYINEYLGMMPTEDLDWLAISEHRLLGFTSGKLFVDMLNMSEVRSKLAFYPQDVKLYLIASQWALIAEEQAFVKRCSDCGDELGSRIVCSRIVERLIRLCYLYSNKYAPYSKWLGSGFKLLFNDSLIFDALEAAISADVIQEREKHIVHAQTLVAHLHNKSRVTEIHDVRIQKYYGRDIDVIFANELAEKTKKMISNPILRDSPLIGSMSQVGNLVALTDNHKLHKQIKQLY
jgi:hypothetical protein